MKLIEKIIQHTGKCKWCQR